MEITWHGNSCFKFKSKDTSLVINPDASCGKLKGDIVLSSLGDKTAEVEGPEKVFTWPGEYEVNDVPIVGFPAYTKSLSEEEDGGTGDQTVVFYFEFDGFNVVHLGEIGHALSSDVVKQMGDVDILFVPVGEKKNLTDKKLMEIIEAIEPRMIIPMGDEPPQAHLKSIGADEVEPVEKLVLKSRSELSDDKRDYAVLTRA